MAAETALSFLRMLGQGSALPPAIVICGPQAFLREYVLDALRSRLTRDGRQYRSLQAGPSGGFGAVVEELQSQDLFAPRKVVACRIPRARRGQEDESEADSGSGPRTGDAALAELIEGKRLAAQLILAYERDSAPAKIRRAVERAGILVSCFRPFDNQLAQYAQAFALAAGLKLTPDAADLLASRHGGDLAAMANALAKAALHFEAGARLKPADLMEPAAARAPELFELGDSLARGQTLLTIALFDRAIALGRDVFEILAVEIIPVIRRMTLAAAMIERGGNTQQIAAALGMSPTSGMAGRAVEGARRFGLARLRRAHQQVCDLDAQFKMGLRREREVGISRMLVELMVP